MTELTAHAMASNGNVLLSLWIGDNSPLTVQATMTAEQAERLAKMLLEVVAEFPRAASAADLGLAA